MRALCARIATMGAARATQPAASRARAALPWTPAAIASVRSGAARVGTSVGLTRTVNASGLQRHASRVPVGVRRCVLPRTAVRPCPLIRGRRACGAACNSLFPACNRCNQSDCFACRDGYSFSSTGSCQDVNGCDAGDAFVNGSCTCTLRSSWACSGARELTFFAACPSVFRNCRECTATACQACDAPSVLIQGACVGVQQRDGAAPTSCATQRVCSCDGHADPGADPHADQWCVLLRCHICTAMLTLRNHRADRVERDDVRAHRVPLPGPLHTCAPRANASLGKPKMTHCTACTLAFQDSCVTCNASACLSCVEGYAPVNGSCTACGVDEFASHSMCIREQSRVHAAICCGAPDALTPRPRLQRAHVATRAASAAPRMAAQRARQTAP
jgi:hypothetical protein